MNNKATFQLTNYFFKKIDLDFETEIPKNIDVNFDVSGIFKTQEKSFVLNLTFTAFSPEVDTKFITINCIATYLFENVENYEDIPTYFYTNSIAILFPYIRSSVSILTIQANIPALVLPTYNLLELEKPLRQNTTIE